MTIKSKYIHMAKHLHQNYPVVDGHLDLPGEILIRNNRGEKNIIRGYYLNNWRAAGINIIVASVFVENDMLWDAYNNTISQINALKYEIDSDDELMLITNKKELNDCLRMGRIGFVLYLEGLDCIGNDVNLLDKFYDLGVRGAALTWSRKNILATGSATASVNKNIHGRITGYGIEAVKKMEEIGMFVDVSHLNDDGLNQMIEIANKPFVATHSCSRFIYENFRNISDEHLEIFSKKCGIIGLNGCKLIAGGHSKSSTILMLCRHIEHFADIIGVNMLGYGFDFCDSYDRAKTKGNIKPMDCFTDHSEIILLTAALLQRGMGEAGAVRLIGSNFIDYFLNNVLY